MFDLKVGKKPTKLKDIGYKAVVDVVSDVCKKCGFEGVWKLLFLDQIRYRGDHRFNAMRIENGDYIRIRVKPKGNDNCWECGLFAPQTTNLDTCFYQLSLIDPRQLIRRLDFQEEDLYEETEKEQIKADLEKIAAKIISESPPTIEELEDVKSNFSLKIRDHTDQGAMDYALIALGFVVDEESAYAKNEQVKESVGKELDLDDAKTQELLGKLQNKKYIRVQGNSCYLLDKGKSRIDELIPFIPEEIKSRLFTESLVRVVGGGEPDEKNNDDQHLTKILSNFSEVKPLVDDLESLNKALGDYDKEVAFCKKKITECDDKIQECEDKILVIQNELKQVSEEKIKAEQEKSTHEQELNSWSEMKSTEREKMDKITSRLKLIFK